MFRESVEMEDESVSRICVCMDGSDQKENFLI